MCGMNEQKQGTKNNSEFWTKWTKATWKNLKETTRPAETDQSRPDW